MSTTETNFITDAQNRFEGCTRERMKDYAEMLGVEVKGNIGDDTLRLRLCAAVGTIAPESSGKAPAVIAERPTEKPNVTTIGRWGGRCRDISLFRPMGDPSPGVPIRWDEMLIYVPYGDGKSRYTIPEPHYNILKDSITRSFTTNQRRTEEGRLYIQKTHTEEPSYPFQDHGVTPGTEHLPGSMLEWYQWEAERKGYFKTFRQSRLEQIYSELTGQAPVTRISPTQVSQWNREKCLSEVLSFLGPAYHEKVSQDEVDPELEAAAA